MLANEYFRCRGICSDPASAVGTRKRAKEYWPPENIVNIHNSQRSAHNYGSRSIAENEVKIVFLITFTGFQYLHVDQCTDQLLAVLRRDPQ